MPTKLPRLNVTVSEEQHALLLELAALNGGSASGYLRLMLDRATPLLRATVPALLMASQEMAATREDAAAQLGQLLEAMSTAGVGIDTDQLDIIDDTILKDGRGSGRRSQRKRASTGQSPSPKVRKGSKG